VILDEDVRRLDVPVDDPGAVGVREGVENLGRDLDGVDGVHGSGAYRLAERASGHVLVGDVHVTRVVADVVGAHAALVPQTARCERFAFRARGRLPLAGDDLEGDIEARPLVDGQPHRSRASAAEGANRAIAPEYELLGGNDGDGGHGQRLC
jgi:hypothetical protein